MVFDIVSHLKRTPLMYAQMTPRVCVCVNINIYA